MNSLTRLLELLKELEQRIVELKAATERKRIADSEQTAAINRVNGCQKAIDTEMRAIKDKAEWYTDWHSQQKRVAGTTAIAPSMD